MHSYWVPVVPCTLLDLVPGTVQLLYSQMLPVDLDLDLHARMVLGACSFRTI